MNKLLPACLMTLGLLPVAAADEVISDGKAEQLLGKYGCTACHTVYGTSSSGPSFRRIAKKYASDPQAVGDLEASVINGSSGAWGDSEMPSNDVSDDDLQDLIVWILQLM